MKTLKNLQLLELIQLGLAVMRIKTQFRKKSYLKLTARTSLALVVQWNERLS